jgi:hypothetical protein
MFDRSGILNVVIAIFAVIGLIAVLGIAGMVAKHDAWHALLRHGHTCQS